MPVDVGQATFEAVVVKGQPFVVQAHEVQDGGVKVVDRCFVDGGLEAKLIAFPITEAASNASSCQEAGEGSGVVIPARPIGLEKRHAAELCRPHDERVFEKASLLHIGDQCGRRLIHDFGLHGMCVCDV